MDKLNEEEDTPNGSKEHSPVNIGKKDRGLLIKEKFVSKIAPERDYEWPSNDQKIVKRGNLLKFCLMCLHLKV